MQFTTATLLSVVSALAAAAPAPQADPAPAPVRFFAILALQSGSSVHFNNWQASKGGILAGIDPVAQNATCDDGSLAPMATFYVRADDGAMFLLEDKLEQRLWVDRGMGQGIVQYSASGGTQPSRQAETTGFEVVNDELLFKGQPFQACPNGEGLGHTIFVNGTVNPAGRQDCTAFKAQLIYDETPTSCNYSN